MISLIIYLSFYLKSEFPIVHFTYASILLSLLFILIVFVVRKFEFDKKSLIIIISIGIFFRIILFPIGPISSDDVYRYLWDGKVQAHGINPYKYAPTDSSLNHLHSDLIPAKVNFQHLKTIYPPFSQWMFFLAYLISGESLWGIKLLLLLSEILTVVLIFLTLKNFNLNEKYSLIYALSPLPIIQFFIDAHVDGFGILLLAVFFYLISINKLLHSYFILGLSIVSKIITIMILPLLLKGRPKKDILKVIFIPMVVAIAVYLPYTFTGYPLEALLIFAEKWYSNGAMFTLFQKIFNDNFYSRILTLIFFSLSFVWVYFSKKEIIEKVYLTFILFFIFSPVVHPWYITWIAFLTSIHFRWSGVIFISTISISNIYAMNYIIKNRWEMNEWFLVLEYLPVIILLVIEEFNSRKSNKLNHALQ